MSVTSAEHHVPAIIDLLEAAASTAWPSHTAPDVFRYQDRSQQERGPGADQPPHLYVWSPTTSSLEQFTRDGTQFDRADVLDILVYSFDETESRQYRDAAVDILSSYLDDNKTATPYATVEPTSLNDYREQKVTRQTDHFVTGLEVEPRGLTPTREIDETAFEVAFDGPFA